MHELSFSFIVPVFNRPNEILELLESIQQMAYAKPFEIVIVEDGSTVDCKPVVDQFANLNISYYAKPNSGPGDSRNYGMQKAQGNYFLILDSDVLLPPDYLDAVEIALLENRVDCFGGVDAADASFTSLQKAINYAMTSFLTTGGIRGGGEQLGKFQPRSFNMGLSKTAFEASKGFGNIHPGEDPDLSLRLWDLGFKTALFPNVKVFHKRRISWKKFAQQVVKFGKCRPILNLWHPKSSKITYWFPAVFMVTFIGAVLLAFFENYVLLAFFSWYFMAVFAESLYKNNSIKIGLMSVWATLIQFSGYGAGFLSAYLKVHIVKMAPKKAFPNLFFEK